MMAGNGTSLPSYTKFESNHLQHGTTNITPKDYRSLSNNRTVATSGQKVSSGFSASTQKDTKGQITIPSNGQYLAQNISLSIDDLADMVEKPEIIEEGIQEGNGIMHEIEGEFVGERDPSPLAKHDFLVSFLVDARGGSMYGCRNSGIKVIIPPKTASQPMRITCRYVKSDNIRYPPVLNDNEGLACRVLKVGPTGSKFLGNVQIEVPYVASLKEGQREIIILKCDSVSKNKWVEHHQEEEIIGEPSNDNSTHRGDEDNDTDDVDKMLKEDMNNHCTMSSTSSTAPMSTPSPIPRREDNATFGTGSLLTPGVWPGPGPGSHSGPSPLPPGQASTLPNLHPVSPHHHYNQYNRSHLERPRQVVRIFTSEFPQYFAIITRTTQEIYDVGPEQRTIELTSVPNTKINIKAKSILKNVNIGLSAQAIEDDLVEEIMAQGGSVSPIVTIEPRRRKFHKAIKVSIPLPPKCLANKKHARGAQINGGDDESVIVTQLSPALKRAGKKGDATPKKTKGTVSISLDSKNTKSAKTTPKKIGKENPTSKQTESEDESSQIETSLRLVCSMSGNHSRAVWEDVTDTTPMTIHLNDGLDDDESAGETAAIVEYETSSHGTPSRQRVKPRRKPKSSESPRSAKSSSSVSSSPGHVEFTTLVSASFWLVHCPNWMRSDMLQLVDQIYKNTNRVPYFCRFHIYGRRGILSHILPEHTTGAFVNSPKVLPKKSQSSSKSNIQSMSSSSSSSSYCSTSSNAIRPSNRNKSASRKSLPVEDYKQLAHLRILCLSEQDRAVHPLELQEDFVEICRTDEFVEIRDKSEIEVRFSGNLVCLDEDEFDLLRSSCVTSGQEHITELNAPSGTISDELFSNIDSHKMIFKPFDDNRMGFAVKRKNEKNLFAKGSISFVTSTAGDKVLYEAKLDLSQFM